MTLAQDLRVLKLTSQETSGYKYAGQIKSMNEAAQIDSIRKMKP